MKELKQSYLNYLTLILTVAVLGVIVFFIRKWKEMVDREEERDSKVEKLEKALKDSISRNKAVVDRINKKITELNYVSGTGVLPTAQPIPVNEPIKTEERNEFDEALTNLMA